MVRIESLELTLRVRRMSKVLDWLQVAASLATLDASFASLNRLEGRVDGGEWRRLSGWVDYPVAMEMLTRKRDSFDQAGQESWVEDLESEPLRADLEARR